MGRPKGSKNKPKDAPEAGSTAAAPPEQPQQEAAPRSNRLPGMEDAGIPELETIAEALNNVRKQRIALSKQEGELSDDLLAMMQRFGKVEYHHEEVHAWREVTEEKVKVHIGELKPDKEKQIKKAVKGHIQNQPGSVQVGSDPEPAGDIADIPAELDEVSTEVEELQGATVGA